MGLRNRIVHGYWDIDIDMLLVTAVDDLPQMIGDLESAIGILDDGQGTSSLA